MLIETGSGYQGLWKHGICPIKVGNLTKVIDLLNFLIFYPDSLISMPPHLLGLLPLVIIIRLQCSTRREYNFVGVGKTILTNWMKEVLTLNPENSMDIRAYVYGIESWVLAKCTRGNGSNRATLIWWHKISHGMSTLGPLAFLNYSAGAYVCKVYFQSIFIEHWIVCERWREK